MQCKVTIDCGNAAFDGENLPYELAIILKKLASRFPVLGAENIRYGDSIYLLDSNGNKVGKCEFIPD